MIRKACPADLPGILVIYEYARAFMRASGNPTQWADGRPYRETLENDIQLGQLYVMEDEGRVHAVFAFILGDDPTYAYIEDGAWISDRPYGTVHRIASDGSHRGVFHECSEFCLSKTGHVRIDTHKDNIPMQTAILREGYSYCGIIYIEDGSPRLAYELEKSPVNGDQDKIRRTSTMNITESIRYIGVNDHNVDLFEGQYVVPNGMAYNSYVIIDDKIAVMDTVDRNFADEWLGNLSGALDGRLPDYLVVQHMEPDHSANIVRFADAYPDAVIVASARAFSMMKNFFGTEFEDRRIVVGEGDSLVLGNHVLNFVTAPMVHWPEVLMTYDSFDQVLFSADGFGKFGALDADEDWACEARRYYFGIVGKYGAQVQAVLKKAAGLDIRTICPLHGPILQENLGYYLGLYDTWSSYASESKGVMIAYTSVYGNTKKAVELLAEELQEKGCEEVIVTDLARCDMAEAVEDAFRYDRLVLATTTYNGDIFPFMKEFIHHLKERSYQNRKVGLIENGSWAPVAAKTMRGMLEGGRNLTFTETIVRIMSALNDENLAQIDALAAELV